MTATPPEQGISPARLHGEACFVCGSAEPPLHPNGTVTIDGDAPGVVHDFETAVCTMHLGLGHGQ